MKKIIPVILCGGSGTRLWPLSRSGFPKQFLSLNSDASLFQQAASRMQGIGSNLGLIKNECLVVSNEESRFLILEQLREIKQSQVKLLLEPLGKNTAPALTMAALCAIDLDDDPILVVTPADQSIENIDQFNAAIHDAIRVAEQDAIVVLGIKANSPETGYGYIKQTGAMGENGDYAVEAFKEKPNADIAQEYVSSGNYTWNSGMFVLKASVWLKALKKFRPDIYDNTVSAWASKNVDQDFIRPDKNLFSDIPSESIDYAVIENCPGSEIPIRMVPLDAGWSDLGEWDAVWEVGQKDSQGNVALGDVLNTSTTNSLLYSSSRLVCAVGLKDVVVVETPDAVLVADRHQSQEVKKIVAQLQGLKREELSLHRKVHRPWGWYDSIDEEARFKVKRIQVKPGATLSLQMHHHRAEHWIVVKGTAQVTCGDKVMLLTENQSTYIPLGVTHRLMNPGTIPLEIIEVQSGSYLGEDDIVRFEDNYGR